MDGKAEWTFEVQVRRPAHYYSRYLSVHRTTFEGKERTITPRFRTTLLILLTISLSQPRARADRVLISGRVIAPDGTGVPYANIYVEDGSEGTTSNRDGRFVLVISRTPPGKVIIHHSAFQSDSVEVEVLKSLEIEIQLERKTYQFNPVVVYGNRYGKESLQLPVSHSVLDFSSTSSAGVSIGEKVDRYGMQVRDYGGPAGLKTVSSPTGYSEHILIMLDGFALNSPQNGVFDLSSLPAEFFSHGEFYPGQASSLYGSHAVGGTLNLLPTQPESFVKFRSGSLGDSGVSGETSLRLGSSHLSFYGNQFVSEGNYRKNNRFRQEVGGAKLRVPDLAGWNVSGYILATRAERGIPGALQYPSPNAGKENNDHFLLLTGRTVSRWGQTELTAGALNSDEHYTNPDWAVDSRHKVADRQARMTHRLEPSDRFSSTASLELRQTEVKSDDAGDHDIVGGAAALLSQFRLGHGITLSPSFRLDWDDHSDGKIVTGNLAILWSSNGGLIRSVTMSSGTSYRAPNFNDLFWEDALGYSMGNPDLEPERGISTHLKINLTPMINEQIQLSATGVRYSTENLIQWAPDEAWVYSPQNVLKSASAVVGLSTTVAPRKMPLRATVGIETTDSRVLSKGVNHGKQLLYVPPSSYWAEVRFALGKLQADVSYRYLGRRRYSYADDVHLKPYQRMDASLRYELSLRRFKLTLEGGARNVLDDQDLQSVYDYPEPGRTLFMAIGATR